MHGPVNVYQTTDFYFSRKYEGEPSDNISRSRKSNVYSQNSQRTLVNLNSLGSTELSASNAYIQHIYFS